MTVLPRRALGRTALRVSELGFGAAPLGGLYTDVSEEDAEAAIDAALAGGVTYFDTAPLYGHGLSEHRLGRVLRRIARDRFVLSTKVGRLLRPTTAAPRPDGLFVSPLPFDYVYDYSRDGARRSIEDSLQFPLAHPAVATVVAGARSRAEVEANVGLLSQPIPPGFWQELEDEGLLPAAAPVPRRGAPRSGTGPP